jgi:hypothetical protein
LPGTRPRSEGRLGHGDADIGRHHQRHAAAEAVAVDRRDDRLPHLEAAVEDLVFLGQPVLEHLRLAVDEAFQVRARGKRLLPRAGDDGAADLRIVAHRGPALRQGGVMIRVERVHPLRPVHGDQRDAVGVHFEIDAHGPRPVLLLVRRIVRML